MSNHEAEMAIIGAAILDPSTLDIAAAIVAPSDFGDRELGQTFALLVDLHAAGEPIADHTILVNRLKAAGLLERLGGVSGIGRIMMACPNPRHVSAYASEIKAAASRRRLKTIAAELADRADDLAADPGETIGWADSQLSHCRTGADAGSISLAWATKAAIGDIAAGQDRGRVSGLPTGLLRVDQCLGGLYPGELVILAARPSIGKSAMGCQIAVHNAEFDRPVLFVSLEMTARDIALRKLANRLGYEVRTLRAGRVDADDITKATAYATELEPVPMFLWSSRSATLAKIRAAARVQQATTGLRLLVVDYLGLIAPADRRKPRWEQMTEASGELKSLALELEIPVLCLCQLNREAERGAPGLHHLRDAGAIEQDADVVMLLHRESRDATSATLDIAKNRNGATGAITLGFDPAATQFNDACEWQP